MRELRWILLIAGVAFCLGLWWWETRRRRQASGSLREFESDEPHYLSPSASTPEPARRLVDERASLRIEPTFNTGCAELPAQELDAGDETAPAEPVDSAEAATPADEPPNQEPAPSTENRIVSLRLVAPADKPFSGAALLAALRMAGMEHGKFAIFHKHGANGKPLFSVASLVEPGNFDLRQMPTQQYKGVTFFAMSQDAGEAGLAEMQRTAQQIAGRLHGVLTGET